MANKKKQTPYVIEYFKVNDERRALVIYIIMFALFIILLLGFSFGTMVFYAFVTRDSCCVDFNWNYIAEKLDGSAVLFSNTLTLCVTIISALFNYKLKFISRMVDWLISKRYKRQVKKYGLNEISDHAFQLANNIIADIKSSKDQATKFYALTLPHEIDNFELIFAIYQQLHGVGDAFLAGGHKIKHILLYDFSIASGVQSCREMLRLYKEVEQISDIIIISNRNFLSIADQIRIHENLKSNYTLANSIYEINKDSTSLIGPTLSKYHISSSKLNSYDPIAIVLIILDCIFGYIPYSALQYIFPSKNLKKIISTAKRKKLFGKSWKISNRKVYKLNETKILEFLRESNDKIIGSYASIEEKLLDYLYEMQMVCAHLELSALFNIFDEKTANSIDKLLEKDCFYVAFQKMNLYLDDNSNINNKKTLYCAIIQERCGSIEKANELLCQIKNMPISVDEKGILSFTENMSTVDFDKDFFDKFAFVLFENTHGQIKNRNTILNIIHKVMTQSGVPAKDYGMYKYWELHINLEMGNNYEMDGDISIAYLKWIDNYKIEYSENCNNYRYLHNLRRAYSDYANSTYLSILNNFNDNSDQNAEKCYKMLETVCDSRLIYDLSCYSNHMQRMAIGDLIMNYCLPMLAMNSDSIPSKIKVFLMENGYKSKTFNDVDLSQYALEVYQKCFENFHLTQDKSEKTTKTRICAIQMMMPDAELNYPQLDKDIKDFYMNSDFEVFKSYGMALRLKLYLLQAFEINFKAVNALYELESIEETQNLYDAELKKCVQNIINLYDNEIVKFGFSNFSSYSQRRFCFLLSFLKIIRLFIENTSVKEFSKKVDKILGQLSKCSGIGIENEMATILFTGCTKHGTKKNSYHECIKLLKNYPIILL